MLALRLAWFALFLYAFWSFFFVLVKLLGRRPLWGYKYNILLCLAVLVFSFWVVYAGELSRLPAPWYWLVGHFVVLSLLLYPFGWMWGRLRDLALGRVEGGSVRLNHLARIVVVLFGWAVAVAYEYHALPFLQG